MQEQLSNKELENIGALQKNQNNFFRNFCFGGLSAFTAKVITLPMQMIVSPYMMLRQQSKTKNTNLPNFVEFVRRVIKIQFGRHFLWNIYIRNFGVFFHVSQMYGFNFAFNHELQKMKKKTRQNSSYKEWVYASFFMGGLSGSLHWLLTYGFKPKPSSLFAFQSTESRSTIKHYYKGFFISCLATFVYRGLFFGLYQVQKNSQNYSMNNRLQKFAIFYGISFFSNLLALPIYTIYNRQMLFGPKYNGSLDCAAKIFQEQGLYSFFKGAKALLWTTIFSALTLTLYDYFNETQDNLEKM